MKQVLFVAAGALFGFLLVQAQATSYDRIVAMFLLRDFHLMIVIGVAIATAAAGLALLRRTRARSLVGAPLELEKKPWKRGLVAGSLLFGVGWGLCGTCPGTALVQIGMRVYPGVIVAGGIFVGTLLHGALARRAAKSPAS